MDCLKIFKETRTYVEVSPVWQNQEEKNDRITHGFYGSLSREVQKMFPVWNFIAKWSRNPAK